MELIRIQDADPSKAYKLYKSFPKDENGYINPVFGYSYKEFLDYVEKKRKWTNGEDLPKGFVADTTYVLDDNGEYVGAFNFRHYLNDFLREGPGHIGYGIKREFRGRGYASIGLKLLIAIVRTHGIDTPEIYLEVNKDNPASLRVQLKNGAYIHHESEKCFYTRIPIWNYDISLTEVDLKSDTTEAEKSAVSVDEMREADAHTIRTKTSGRELMYRAATGVYQAFDGWSQKTIAIIVGGGNNGGDGYALAGILKENGINSTVYKVTDKVSEDGSFYCDISKNRGVLVRDFSADTDLNGYEVIVDCILGTGFKGEVRGLARDAITAINGTNAYVISVDINSGMNGDTGEAILAVRSDITVSIGYFKKGMFSPKAKSLIKRLVNADIGIVDPDS